MDCSMFSNLVLKQQQQNKQEAQVEQQQQYHQQLNQVQNVYFDMLAQEDQNLQMLGCENKIGGVFESRLQCGFGNDMRGGGNSSRAASPTSVLTHDLRGSFQIDSTTNKQVQVLTPQGIAQINTQPQNVGEDAYLNEILSSLLGVCQQNEQQMFLQQPTAQAPVLNGYNIERQQPRVQQVDLMQQILTSPFGNPLYKTELCRPYDETGCCRFGDRCKYAHGEAELKPAMRCSNYKTRICKTFVERGCCPYGSRCNFIHAPLETTVSQDEGNDVAQGAVSERSSSSNSSTVSSPRRLPVFVWLTEMGAREEQQ